MNLPSDIGEEWCEGFCSEVQVVKHRNGQPYHQWQKLPGIRNEPLDCSVYAYSAAVLAGITRINWENMRERLSETVEDVQKKKARSRKAASNGGGNWVKGW